MPWPTIAGSTPRPEEQQPESLTPYLLRLLTSKPNTAPAPQPRTQALDAYSQNLQSMPERQNPSWKNKLLSGLLGAGVGVSSHSALKGAQYSQYLLDKPYEDEMDRWQQKSGYLQKLAAVEDQYNENDVRTWSAGSRNMLDQWRIEEAATDDLLKASDRDRRYNADRADQASLEAERVIDNARQDRSVRATERGLGLRETEAGLEGDRNKLTRERLEFDKSKEEKDRERETLVDPSNLIQATPLAITDVVAVFPEYRRFVDTNDKGDPVIIPPDTNNPEEQAKFNNFRIKLRQKQEEYASKKTKLRTR